MSIITKNYSTSDKEVWFTSDGKTGTGSIVVIDTASWTANDWKRLATNSINASSDDLMSLAVSIDLEVEERSFDNEFDNAKGIYCWIQYGDGEFGGNTYISFGTEVEDDKGDIVSDSFGMPDDDIVYYLDDEEKKALKEALFEVHDMDDVEKGFHKVQGADFLIDFTEGYELNI